MITNFRLLAAVSLALATSGCSLMVDPKARDPLKTAEGFCRSVQDVANDLACDAFSPAPAMSVQVQARAASDQLFEHYRGRCDTFQAAVDAGRFAYAEAEAPACIAALERRGCRGLHGEVFEWPDECRRAVQGAVQPGGACSFEVGSAAARQGVTGFRLQECSGGASCYTDGAACADACCPRICRLPTATAGGPCQTADNPQVCADGMFCTGGYCSLQVGPGGWCGSVAEICNPRTSACNFNSTSCEALPTLAQLCSTTTSPSCAPGLYCDYTTTPGICKPKPVEPRGAGGYCGGLSTRYCADGLYCDMASRTCASQRTSGLCTNWDECAPGYGCVVVGGSNTCTRLGDVGATCGTDPATGVGCLPGLYCSAAVMAVSGTCVLPPGQGQSCLGAAATGICAPGLRPYTPPPPSTCTCQPFLGEGEACAMSDECGLYAGTGRTCFWDGMTNTCRTKSCLIPAGWFATGSSS